ncbi:MAG: hypothetical protein JXA35_00095 [Deltaproteobacteria bacterium]|nr:hypothetical protein [Deltaproteobacteria bacterium]
MELYSTELLKVILNVLVVGLWGITIIYLLISRLRRSQVQLKNNDQVDILEFNEELKLQTAKNRFSKPFETGSENIRRDYRKLPHFEKKADLDKINKHWKDFRDKEIAAGIPGGNSADEYSRVISLAEMGLSAKEVSKRLKMPKGEVELVIKLRGGNCGKSENTMSLNS